MRSLIQRFRTWRRQRAPRERTPEERHERRVLWAWAGVAFVALLAFYFWLTSARILAQPVEIDFGPRDPHFMGTLGPLLGAEFTAGNHVRLLSNGKDFFPAMLEAIARAKHSVTLETYIWSSGAISDQFIAALGAAAKRGVKVHVLADGMGTINFKREDRQRLLDAGAQFLVYGREHWWQIKPDINHRTHRKLLVVDGRVGFTGGMCIDDRWLGDATEHDRWREVQIELRGPVVRQMQSVFAANWLQTTGRLLIGEGYFPAAARDEGAIAQCFKSGPNEDPENARISYLLAIAAARKSIRIMHAYFVPDDLAIDMLLAARARGVEIEVIVPLKNDSRFGRAASRSRWGRLLTAGVKFFRYEPAMYHCKLMLVDDFFLTIGSVNFDNRSFGINDEVNANVLDDAAARDALRLFKEDRAKSVPLSREEFERRPWWQKIIDHFCGLFRSQL
ncbi:MAG: cardiolipin synthase B [Opitutae bacterium]|nr:cardiolipin synthase B [Opitutae bacterium]